MIFRSLLVFMLLLVSAMAQAATISLTPAGQSVVLGNQASFDLLMDFSDEATLGGAVDILYDGSRLDFVSFVFDATFLTVTDPLLTCPGAAGCASIDQPNAVTNIQFGDFGGISGPFTVGTLTFDTLLAGLATLTTAETTGAGGPFVSNITYEPQLVNYQGANLNVTNVTGVPLPSALWLMVSALLWFVPGMRRR